MPIIFLSIATRTKLRLYNITSKAALIYVSEVRILSSIYTKELEAA
jgi:hypothetical protein